MCNVPGSMSAAPPQNTLSQHYCIFTLTESVAHLESVLQSRSIIKSMTKDCTQLLVEAVHSELELH